MSDLTEALTILLKYGDPDYPIWCEHDALHVGIDAEEVSEKDKGRLEQLGFFLSEEEEEEVDGGFISFRFGSV